MKHVVITGATSMLGLALINECIKENTKVLAIVRRESKKRDLLPNSALIKVIEKDLNELHDCKDIPKGNYDVFYHFAWEATENKRRYDVEAQHSNIVFALDALKLAKQMGCHRFIGAGSQAEYGRVDGTITPDYRVAPDSAYGISKYTAGRLCLMLAEQLEIECIWTRIFSTYGICDMPSTMIMYCIDSLLKGEKPQLTKCEQQWDYLNSRDAARAFYLIGEKGKAGSLYNIGSGNARPLIEYVELLRNEIDPSLPLGIGEKEYVPQQVMYLCPDISNLQNDTGFKAEISFKEGIKEVIAWYQKRENLK